MNASPPPLTARWLQSRLLKWYDLYGRKELPWKNPKDPYRIWLSEIMLQQTQVNTVLGYFTRFVKSFPTLHHLAKAPREEVMAHWAGLGYYARARNLHQTAQILDTEHRGQFPRTVDALIKLPGIGRSTAGAILAQSFDISAPILDGNVKRVLTRLHTLPGWPDERKMQEKLWALQTTYTPSHRVADFTQAIMDLGATCCVRGIPACEKCPLRERCQAYLTQTQSAFPHKKPTKPLPRKNTCMLCVISQQGEILLEKRPPKGIWGGLYSLPAFEDIHALKHFLKEKMGKKRFTLREEVPLEHTFTHFHLTILPFSLTRQKPLTPNIPHFHWQPLNRLEKIGLPAPVKKLINRFSF
jgi:A/G-specific adenine glycosylase